MRGENNVFFDIALAEVPALQSGCGCPPRMRAPPRRTENPKWRTSDPLLVIEYLILSVHSLLNPDFNAHDPHASCSQPALSDLSKVTIAYLGVSIHFFLVDNSLSYLQLSVNCIIFVTLSKQCLLMYLPRKIKKV